jgi:glycosyltransferase involved in cell wall biosynthesis
MSEMQPLPIATPPAMLEVNQVSPSLTSSTSEGHPAPVQNASLPEVPETLIPSSPISPALFDGVIERPEYPRISVVIPTRNEAANLPHVLPRIPAIIAEVILVDGHSTDETIEVAQQLLPGIRVIEQRGKGKGNAVSAGLEIATGDIIVLLDADGSADPQEIPTFVEALLAGNDFAKGSRFAKGGGSNDITMLRRFGNHGLCGLVNILFGTRFSDLCYGYNAFWKHCLDYVAIDSDGFEVETLINIRMHEAGLKISEVPSFEYQRIHGTSNLNIFRDGWLVLKTILRERKRKPSLAPQPLQVEPVISAVEHMSKSEEIVL